MSLNSRVMANRGRRVYAGQAADQPPPAPGAYTPAAQAPGSYVPGAALQPAVHSPQTAHIMAPAAGYQPPGYPQAVVSKQKIIAYYHTRITSLS